ncbi:Putative sensory histidine kinase YfhA [Cronobacter malonaticus 507]|nr:Putative sensory histidine kinase YfhA [Cronobacter malonaticus 507]
MTQHKPARLLLVDDDPGLLKLLGLRLTSEGFTVETAESGHEGLRILAREKIDLVISDLRMDEMDGMQLFAEIQKLQPGMPVIILTAHGSIFAWRRPSRVCSVFLPNRWIKTRCIKLSMMRWRMPRPQATNSGARRLSPAAP